VALTGSKAYLEGNLLLIDCQSPLFLNLMRTSEQCSGDIREAARAVTGQTFRLGPYKKAAEQPEKQEQNDKLSKLIDNARASGVDVTIKE
jgi:DNA polymerase-3 subunit gamma/tau